MIDRIKQAMRDTGVCDRMSDEDLDIGVGGDVGIVNI